MSDTLVLNADYRPLCYLPLSTVPWQQAMKLTFMDRVTVVENHKDWVIHTPRLTIPVPSIVITKDYMKYKRTVRFSRKNLYLRDLYQCQYCSETFDYSELTIDHVVPVSKGGKTTWENCVAACKTCNTRKGNKHMLPIRLPFKPEYWHLVGNNAKSMEIHIKYESWKLYLS